MSTAAPVRGYVFDAYGTLFDVHSIVEVGREITADRCGLSTGNDGSQARDEEHPHRFRHSR